MATKKSFSISQDLAKGIRSTLQSASTNKGQFHYDMMELELLEPDPNNPRRLSITFDEIQNGVNKEDPNFLVKERELDALKELSESIKRIGIKNAIEVYKMGSKYRIITGERRYWAAFLASQKAVPVKISDKPDEFNLRYTQWVENINRQDLSLSEKYQNLVLIAEAFKRNNQTEFTEHNLQSVLGISQIQAYRYFSLLKADENILQLLKLGKLNNLKLIQELVTMKDKGARNQIISWIRSSKNEVTSLNDYRQVAGKKTKPSSEKPINLGKIKNSNIVKFIFNTILADKKFEHHQQTFNKIDWSSSRSISNAFKDLIRIIEKAEFLDERV